ncbi:alpha/beta fold hydrolase [Cobetia marina]|uniref:alpha/beta fold hydrolase n=1 Tax=Cobetia marina TaxID=28258 RepID=UPI001141DDDA|nr:alpha/beta hydrolase [Cobetia marina]GED43923.1 hydrolase [Cobetia marina]
MNCTTGTSRPSPRPLTFTRRCGGEIAALEWRSEQASADAPVWLALHGWLDNAASFTRLAPLLCERLGIRIVAIDLVGHGRSSPQGPDGDYAVWDYCHDVIEALEGLRGEGMSEAPVTLLAHSLGAAVAGQVAAALPGHVARLVLIDGIGALATPADEVVGQLRRGLLARHARPLSREASGSQPSRRAHYRGIEEAVAARVAGGVTPVDAETIRPVVERNLEPLEEGWRLCSDRRLLRPSVMRYTPEQVLALLAAVNQPVLLIEGEQGILRERPEAQLARAAVRGLERCVLPGGHHLHLEPGHVAAVAARIIDWTVAGE